MSSPNYVLRRATVDDLAGLKLLWERAHLQVLDLEKRLTEFQLVVTENGDLVAAIGLQIDGKHGKIHSEALAQTEDQDRFRRQLWDRIQTVARNHGLVRLWMRESAPFWAECGFKDADPESIKKLSPAFGDAGQRWSWLQLKEESAAVVSIEKELELFQASQRESVEKVMQQAKVLKYVAYVVLGIIVLIGGLYLLHALMKNPGAPLPGQR